MQGKTLARIGAAVFVGVAITATAIEMTRKEEASARHSPAPSALETADPLRRELARCGVLGEAAMADRTCLRAWAENRRRFLDPRDRAEDWAADADLDESDAIRRETMPVEPADEER